MLTVLSILQALAAVMLVGFILLQPSKDGGAFGASAQTMTGNSAGTSAPFKMTMICAAFLAISSLFMSWVHINDAKVSVVDQLTEMPLNPDIAPAVPPATLPPETQTAPGENGNTQQ